MQERALSLGGVISSQHLVSTSSLLPLVQKVEHLTMTREKPACVLDGNLLGSFSPALCVEHTDDVLPVQVPS